MDSTIFTRQVIALNSRHNKFSNDFRWPDTQAMSEYEMRPLRLCVLSAPVSFCECLMEYFKQSDVCVGYIAEVRLA